MKPITPILALTIPLLLAGCSNVDIFLGKIAEGTLFVRNEAKHAGEGGGVTNSTASLGSSAKERP